MSVTDDPRPAMFRLLVVPGVIVDRWSRTWSQRLPETVLELVPAEAADAPGLMPSHADAGLVRLPVDRDALHAIPLYTETTVVVMPRDHLLTAADELTTAELAEIGEPLLRPLDEVLPRTEEPPAPEDRPATTAAAVELVAAGAGLLVVPQSLARLHHRRDLTFRVVTDAPVSSVALAWPRDGHTDLVEEMIGIVRGRTANSTRGRPQPQAAPERPARKPAGGARRAGPHPRRRGR
ncbi:LysR substrate-binding domain-containing protein [Dactylosporangium fulvum]|uniref:LysR substrate-binding domain-containing protein n=2 Tax=Dactylosporangium fulvum TaxID=53359 RepID=A0ABY5VQD0_9ACTN|nr:LysR substrate-binding domain-containing protein [Dactylosporangium fulvum]UWP79021.1 LysR substrate-binding domain-containing protein [Dactylosporangium fulvum]